MAHPTRIVRQSARVLLAALLLQIGIIPAAKGTEPDAPERHLLYVVAPGIRDSLEFGGAGILVFDMDHNHAFIKRIDTTASAKPKPENIKGVCANAATSKLYFSTPTRLYCLDLKTEKVVWEKALPGGCDRMSLTPDGKLLYVPSFEGPHWNIVDGATGDVVTKIETKSGAHNTVVGLDGKRAYLAGLKSPVLTVVDVKTQKGAGGVGPFSAAIRPFTINAAGTLCFVNVNDLLGFEIGDLKTGKKLHRVEIEGFQKGPIKRHGCPSHGVGLTPDEQEVWVCDAANSRVHVFDATQLPPKQVASVSLRDQPGWVTFSLDGRYAYPSTGEVVDTKTKKIIGALKDEKGREVHSEKMVEIVCKGAVPVRTGDQFGLGRAGQTKKSGSSHGAPAHTPKTILDKPGSLTPPRRHQILASGKAAGGYAAFPDVCRTTTGDLVCVFYSGYEHVSHPNKDWPKGGRMMAVRSTDNAKTWGEPFVLADTVHDDRDPHIAMLRDGTLLCNWFAIAHPEKPLAGNRPIAIFLSRSGDNGKTWSEPTELKIDSAEWFACSAPVRELPDGTLILGLYTENAKANRAFGATIKSHDAGKSWQELALIGENSGHYLDAETDVIRLKDGTLLAALRSSKTDLYLATSSDQGKSWGKVYSSGFKGHCPHFLRHSSGAILLAHRIPATALHWTFDEGKTWQGPLQIDSVGGAYPSCVELPDGSVYCVYYEEGAGSSIRGALLKVSTSGVTLESGLDARHGSRP